MTTETMSAASTAAVEKLKAANGASVKLPTITAAKLIKAGLAVKAGEGSGERGYGMYRAA